MSWLTQETLGGRLLTGVLKPASLVWGLAAYCRLVAYGKGIIKQEKVSVPVSSIGNLTCGGTGKTPLTIDLARRLVGRGGKVAILSRGYRRQSREDIVVVSDGNGRLASPAESGDEPYLMAQAVPQAVVIVGAKRAITAQIATAVYGCDHILLDDGFQHLGVARDTDIVLLDYNDDPDRYELLPAGRLREPLSALARADWAIVTKVPQDPDPGRMEAIKALIARWAPHALRSQCRFLPGRVRPAGCADTSLPPGSLSGVRVVAFAGIARPRLFFKQLRDLGADVVRERAFPDHHWYRESDIERLKTDLKRHRAELLITTEKDGARLGPSTGRGLPVSVLELATRWLGPVPLAFGADLSTEPTTAGQTSPAPAER